MTTIALPWPPKELTPNFKRRKHWSAYRGPTKAYREQCAWLTKAKRVDVYTGELPIALTITFYPPDARRRDDDGMIGAFKAGRDGIADALGIDDRHFRPTYVVGDAVKGGAVMVTIGGDA